MVIAAAFERGVPAILEIGDRGRGFLRSEELAAFDALKELAIRGEIGPAAVPLGLAVAEVARFDPKMAAAVEIRCQAALAVHGADMRTPGRARVAVEMLADLQSKEQETPAVAPRIPHDRFRAFSAVEIASDPPRQEFILQDLLPVQKVAVLAAAGGTGKTSLAVGLAVHRAMGRVFLGRRVKPGRTVIVSTEDGADDYLRKLCAWREVMVDMDFAAVAERVTFFDLAGVPFSLVDCQFGQATVASTTDALANAIKEKAPGADLIVAETVSRLGGGDESNGSMSALIVAAERLALLTGAAVLLIAHVSKAASRENINDQHAARGGSAITDNARAALVLTRLDKEQAGKLLGFTLPEEELRDLLLLNPAKGNFAPRQDPIILERMGTPWGLALREYQAAGKGDPAEARAAYRAEVGARLRSVVASLTEQGESVTLNKLRDDFRPMVDLAKGKVAMAVQEAIEDGFLHRGEHTRGGGTRLLPDQSPGKSPSKSPGPTRPTAPGRDEGAGASPKLARPPVLGVGEKKHPSSTPSRPLKSPKPPDLFGAPGDLPGDFRSEVARD